MKAYLATDDEKRKRYYACHCPFAKESILSEHVVPSVLCNCSLGHVMNFTEAFLGRALEGKVVCSVLHGDLTCEYEITIPDDIMRKYGLSWQGSRRLNCYGLSDIDSEWIDETKTERCQMTTLEQIRNETMVFMRGKYRLDEIGDGKDVLKFMQGRRTIVTIYIYEDHYSFLIIFGKKERETFWRYKDIAGCQMYSRKTKKRCMTKDVRIWL